MHCHARDNEVVGTVADGERPCRRGLHRSENERRRWRRLLGAFDHALGRIDTDVGGTSVGHASGGVGTVAAIERFEAETGIDVTVDVYDSNETLEARLLAGSTGFDIVVPTTDFMARQIAAGVYQPLNRDLLPNLSNMDEGLMARAARFDPDNAHSTMYMWGTTGLGVNIGAVEAALGAD